MERRALQPAAREGKRTGSGSRAVLFALALAGMASSLACQTTGTPAAQPPAASAASVAGEIRLPDVLAIELPAPGLTTIMPDASPARDLLQAASAGRLQVTHDQTAALRLGANLVTWTAWEGAPGQGAARHTRSASVYVFPFGQTPAGVSGYHNMTAGNHSSKVVRDAAGGVHVAWLDGGEQRPGNRVLYRRGSHDPQTGRMTWESDPIAVNETSGGARNSFLALEASERAVHFAWYSGRSVRYRRLVRDGGQWRFEPIRDTGVSGALHDTGPDIATRGDSEIHVLTPTGQYARSVDAGSRWSSEDVPRPGPAQRKNAALAVDALGNAHVVFTYRARNSVHWQSSRPNGGHWPLHYVRRRAAGGWEDAQHALGRFPEWGDFGRERDTLADWADIAVDGRGHIHVAWHGTAGTGIYGRDEAFYMRRPAAGPGRWGDWEAPQPLLPPDRAKARTFSFAPSLAWDPGSDSVVAVLFFESSDLPREIFDSAAVILRGGKIVGAPIPLSQMTRLPASWEDGISVWFPTAAPRLYQDAGARIWLDVLSANETPKRKRSASYAIYQRVDLTPHLGR